MSPVLPQRPLRFSVGRRSMLCYLTSNSPSDLKCLSLRPLRDALPPPPPPDSLSLSPSLTERAQGQMSVLTAAAAKYGPSWLKPKVNKIGSKCINFTDKPFTTSVVGWIKSQFRHKETTGSSSEWELFRCLFFWEREGKWRIAASLLHFCRAVLASKLLWMGAGGWQALLRQTAFLIREIK